MVDRTIPIGKQWDSVIEEQLESASCVVVLWSKASAASSWVRTESAEAMRRGVLVPALIEDAKIPLEFRRLQAADLTAWRGNIPKLELERLVASITAHITNAASEVSPQVPPSRSPADKPATEQRGTNLDPVPEIPRDKPDVSRRSPKTVRNIGLIVVLCLAIGGSFYYVSDSGRKQMAIDQATTTQATPAAPRPLTEKERAKLEARRH